MTRTLLALLAIPLVSACAASTALPPSTTGGVSTYSPKGLEGVLGSTEGQLKAMFGEPRLTIPEPPALKLQFVGRACVLDAYLYPPDNGGAQRVTHVDARNSAGAEVDRAACVAALQR